ncbi:hypothetical protein Q4Q34_02240 [Flavivirga abyssicola]|uniref:hypothetical protein n=1 Tax=Flavivirga abyssicola TaxID=3063533 RepID=UPI0026DF6712|nr:hypothetical protein [Flavivirga sp. MEBiC07777]WVK13858.1 hypothetical protein Q4Q34_02240 [Flavivirga sp. MEBiC07777]
MNNKMNLNFKLFSLLLVLTLLNCKNENSLSEYKYANMPVVLTCGDFNSKLYHEALYAFENDILTHYSNTNKNASQTQSYNLFVRDAIYGRAKYEDVVSEHTYKVFQTLKNENTLWDANNTKSHLNYNSTIVNCISNNIQDTALKTTFNSLITTSSMSPKLFGAPLMSKYRTALKDKYLATYIALDLFYSKLFDVDFSKVNFKKPESKVDFNKKPE